VHKIPMPEYKFTDFADIKQGKFTLWSDIL
jgi:hypothetical protein